MVEANNVSLTDELSRLQTLEQQLELNLAEKEEIWRQKTSLEAEASSLRDEQVNLIRNMEEMRQQFQLKESSNDQASTVEVSCHAVDPQYRMFHTSKRWQVEASNLAILG